jgi:hypothetical protein
MPTLIVETGAGLPDSNSYATLAEADAYFLNHPYYADNWSDLGIPDRERYLVSATFQLDAYITWDGYIASTSQALDWPRTGVVDEEGRIVASDVVPKQVKVATYEMAVFSSQGDPYAPSSSAGLDRLKIDVIELEFTSGGSGGGAGGGSIATIPARALLALKGLGEYAYGSNVRKVLVG